MNYQELKVGDTFWMSSYTAIASIDNKVNNNIANKYDVQQMIFSYIDTELYRGGVSVICKWGKCQSVIVCQQHFETFASKDKWYTKSKCFLRYINDKNRLYLNAPLVFSESELIEFNICKDKYPEMFI